MAEEPAPAQKLIGDFAPKLVELTDEVLFGDVWQRPGLSVRDRSLVTVTVTVLAALGRTEQLGSHLSRALDNGLTKDELVEVITLPPPALGFARTGGAPIAFYAGRPSAMSAITRPKDIVGNEARA